MLQRKCRPHRKRGRATKSKSGGCRGGGNAQALIVSRFLGITSCGSYTGALFRSRSRSPRPMPAIQFLVEKRESGWTVAEMLRKRFLLTWTQAKRIVERGHVRVAGQLTKAPEQRIKAGNRVWIAAGA